MIPAKGGQGSDSLAGSGRRASDLSLGVGGKMGRGRPFLGPLHTGPKEECGLLPRVPGNAMRVGQPQRDTSISPHLSQPQEIAAGPSICVPPTETDGQPGNWQCLGCVMSSPVWTDGQGRTSVQQPAAGRMDASLGPMEPAWPQSRRSDGHLEGPAKAGLGSRPSGVSPAE
ncbi:unnamed protein product [Rangifer tarandus platyrhynchus]|uniref:Uncharacterized protein n=1 Tax=Rangifer tarandus platyrhynchus TaxID=3082113 RepID=A0ABN8Z3E6_RANTA|nr:unnamed protein product [Rangifer tarandus platyrhynchus]